jgi:hypothetical protein
MQNLRLPEILFARKRQFQIWHDEVSAGAKNVAPPEAPCGPYRRDLVDQAAKPVPR